MCFQGVPGQGLSESVRKYRQSVFKLNYKIKKHKSGGVTPATVARDTAPPAASSALPVIPATAAAKVANPDGTPSGSSPAEPAASCEATTAASLLAQATSLNADSIARDFSQQPMGLSDSLAAALGMSMHAHLQPPLQGFAHSLAAAAAAGMSCAASGAQLPLEMQLAVAAATASASAAGALPASVAALPSTSAGAAAVMPAAALQDLSMASLLRDSTDLPG